MINIVKKVNSIKDAPSNVYRFKLKGFREKVRINIQKSKYVVKTAENSRELLEVLKLRYRVFKVGKSKILKIDIDRFDKYADHLLLYDTESRKVVGTYRILSSEFVDRFYSESEFDISSVKALMGVKVELGRACILDGYRNGATLMLLWRAISEYVDRIKASYLFGCSSVFTTDPMEVAFLTEYLLRNYSSDRFKVRPYKTVERLGDYVRFLRENRVDTNSVANKIPPLLKMYLNAGSKVCGLPSLDEEFSCVDFFTVLDTSDLTESFRRKYRKDV